MIQRLCICNNDLTDILLEDIFKDINVHTNFQLELVDSVSAKSTSEINVMHEKFRYTQLKRIVMKNVKKELDLSFQQRLSNPELYFHEVK